MYKDSENQYFQKETEKELKDYSSISLLVLVSFTVIILFSLLNYQSANRRKYVVLITFCDNREPVEVVVIDTHPPSTSDILRTKNKGLTEWNGYLNVCDLQTINSGPL